MELCTISQVCKEFAISTRTLRYYEEIGLLESKRKEDYAYRVYDEEAISRLQYIILLRKLRIPLKEIQQILSDPSLLTSLQVFKKNVHEVTEQINALATIRILLNQLVHLLESKRLRGKTEKPVKDETVLEVLDTFLVPTFSMKEELNMDDVTTKKDLSKKDFSQVTDALTALRDVRVLYIPPCVVASIQYKGESPEEHAGDLLDAFIREVGLYELKPDAKVYGFNNPDPSPDAPTYGYEFWVSIPESLEVKAPFTKKYFEGGLYAAHMITLGNFHEWQWLINWATAEDSQYQINWDSKKVNAMGGLLEDHLNYVYHSHLNWPESDEHQIDLLLPVKVKGE